MHKYSYNPEIDEDKKPLFDVLLDLVEEFKQFCEKHDLTYFAVGGTLLGAVRHNGFIPWDDDVDLGMMRKDYDKLLELVKTEKLPKPYRFLTPLTDPAYGGVYGGTNQDIFDFVTIIPESNLIKVVRYGAQVDHRMRPQHAICIDYSEKKIVAQW